MAIEKAINTDFGIDLENAYIKVFYFSGDNKHVSYNVRIWATEQARREEKNHVTENNYSFEYIGGDILVNCYTDLMARAEYAGARSV